MRNNFRPGPIAFARCYRQLQQENDPAVLLSIIDRIKVDASIDQEKIDEMAFPAYLQGNVASRFIFFGRLARFLPLTSFAGGMRVLDFGCGMGLLTPYLANRGCEISCVDLFPDVAVAYADHLGLTEVRHVTDLADLPADENYDRIVALDVLEHLEDSSAMFEAFANRLRDGGEVLVSGPTENWLYQLGRRIVGFSGDYHHQTIDEILQSATKVGFEVSRSVPWPTGGPGRLFTGAVLRRA
jgi:2-polyprenyl-3-methyl-5-hydroxy-6-metoxy-1,4-benzoquinol methylase